jgi:hypothetical protein
VDRFAALPLPSLLFLVLLVAVFLGHERVFSMLQQGETTLLKRGEWCWAA